jgi:bifunctional UDP-N-acetylglucosamine pyrophosphorylase/glucosamine-1-phosphate N-acetyltransferase
VSGAGAQQPLAVVVLAAGEGKRMRSALPKVLHEVAGQPLLQHVLDAARPLMPERTVVLVGVGGDRVRQRFAQRSDVTFVTQDFSTGYGTGHALRESAKGLQGFRGNVLVLNGDGPLLRSATLAALVGSLEGASGMALVTCHFSEPAGLGRIVRGADGQLNAIVEEKDASEEQRALTEVNPGVYLFDATVFARAQALSNDNAAGEYYITDLPRFYLAAGEPVRTLLIDDETELLGVNDKRQLAAAERVVRDRVRTDWLLRGVTMLDPASTFIDAGVSLGSDVVLEQGVVLRGNTQVGDGARVGAYSVVADRQVAAGTELPPHTVLLG